MFEASGRFTIRYVFVVASYFGDSGILSPSHPPTHSPASFCHLSLPAATADCSGVQVDQVLTPSVCICTWAVGWLMGGWPAIAHSPSRRFVTSSRPVRTPLVAGCRHKLSRSHFTTKGFALGHITHHTATSTVLPYRHPGHYICHQHNIYHYNHHQCILCSFISFFVSISFSSFVCV